ncbi:MAG: PD-(D/E)XK nuclease family protein [Nitrosopumilus sp.]
MNKEYANIIDDLYEQSIINFESKQEARKNIHVSDLVSDCVRKPWYRLHGYKQKEKTFKQALPLVHGTMLHECVDLEGLEHEVALAANVYKDEPAKYTNKKRGKDYFEIVQGAMDDLIEIDDDLIICDKKTTKSIPKEVSLQYKTQMNIYKLLYTINNPDVDIKKAAIIYIDKTTAWAKHKTIVFDLLDIGEIKQFVLDRLALLEGQQLPPREESFLCHWCPFIDECKPNVFRA